MKMHRAGFRKRASGLTRVQAALMPRAQTRENSSQVEIVNVTHRTRRRLAAIEAFLETVDIMVRDLTNRQVLMNEIAEEEAIRWHMRQAA